MTFNQKYYAMNTALNRAMAEKGLVCPVYKYGVVAQNVKYPYMQSTYRIIKRQPNGSATSGTLIDFEYILNFFTAAKHERANDVKLFIPYEAARELIVSPYLMIWVGIANVLNHDETPEFNFKGGLEVIQKGLIFKCQTVISHIISTSGEIVDIDDAMEVVEDSINFE
jgi:hypothetical protein